MNGSETCVWTPLPRNLRIEIRPERTRGEEPAVDAAWGALCAANPRFFNGPILAFEHADAGRALVRVRRDQYKRLAVQPGVKTDIVQLGVTGVLEARDAEGRPHVLLGRRSRETRVFGGMWELGPSGGVDAPPPGQETMDEGDVWRVLIQEIREEIGLPIDPDPAPPVSLLHDPVGRSVELVVRVAVARPVEELIAAIDDESGTSRWEYDAIRWAGIDELGAFARANPVIGATIATWRGLGWV